VRSDPKHRQLARQVGGVSSIHANSMAVTFLHKIVFRPGSTFRFGTISSIANEEGTLHRIADPTERRSSSKISGKIGEKAGKGATSNAPKKDRLRQDRGPRPANPENSIVYLPDERMNTNHKKERNK
jgi:hypothetical protein